LNVVFTDKSTGSPTSWSWNFGDGTSSTEKNPTHTYSTAGTYIVTLTATNAAGSNTVTKSNCITVTGASSQKPVNKPVNNNLYWSGLNWYVDTTHSNTWVDDENNLHMRLEKINNKWCGSLLESRNTVKYGKLTWVSSSPSLNLERNTTIGLFTYHDDRNELDIGINQWPGYDEHLYFVKQPGSVDDHPKNISYGVFSSNPHLNDKNIVYLIEWTPDYVYYSVTASDGTIIQDWTYSNPENIPSINSTICMDLLPLAGSYYPASGNAAEIVLRSFTYTPYESLVEKSNTNTANGVDHSTNDTPGTEQTVQKPVVSFWGSRTSGTSPLTIGFTDASKESPTAWKWSFGDGTYSTDRNPRHTYSKAGTYSVTLTASNAAGNVTKTRTNYIKVMPARKPVASFSSSVTSGNAPLNVAFTDASTGAPTTWKWSFGDGTYSTLQNPRHTYSKAGTYSVKLTAINAAGDGTKTRSKYIKVR
jgi:PKD repeat protein